MENTPAMSGHPLNPPAFPTKHSALDPRSTGFHTEEGMTLRDYFAAKAMQGYMMHIRSDSLCKYYKELAEESYLIADAMLNARQLKEQEAEGGDS